MQIWTPFSATKPKGHTLGPTQGGKAVVDARALRAELARRVEGEVRFEPGSRAMYATDASNYRYVPIGVVVPRSIEDVVQTVAVCREHGAPLLSRGGGTTLSGQCTNVAVVLEWSKYLGAIKEIDPVRKLARVQPGCILDKLRETTVARHQLVLGPDPATHSHCTIGGMIGNNSCGVHAQMTGQMADNVLELEVLTYDGLRMRVGPTSEQELQSIVREGGRRAEIYRRLAELRDRYAALVRERYPRIPRRISGYNLDALLPERGFNLARALVGTEGTCATTLEATVRLAHSPPYRALALIGYPDIFQAGDRVADIDALGPIGLEGLDDRLVANIKKKGLHSEYLPLLPTGCAFLMAEFGGETAKEASVKAQRAVDFALKKHRALSGKVVAKPEEQAKVWEIRESGLGATARVPGEPDNWPGWEDSAVSPDKVGPYLRELRALLDRYEYSGALYGHFGQGCIHSRIGFDLATSAGVAKYRRFIGEATDLVVRYGGSLSGEHGDGQSRAEFLPKMFGPELVQAFREFKAIWDPLNKMNPGRIVDAPAIDQNLRLGPGHRPWKPKTFFKFPDDEHSFDRATQRCVGVGKCRREGGGTMCPSYMVTREEYDTTRGRAHILFEMLKGEVIEGGWRDRDVKRALDLCLSCKGCKGDCPVNVDVATYKAEFLAHYYRGRLRPRAAYSMGLIMWWAKIASLAPEIANLFAHTEPFESLLKGLGGIEPKRAIPRFANETFQHWVKRAHRSKNPNGPPLLLFPDTFNNAFFPETARSALEVLEGAGYRVIVPTGFICCGRPLYDYGMLNLAQLFLKRIMRELRDEIDAGVPIVGLEPSCVSVFRDELKSLFPDDRRARRLAGQVLLFPELLEREPERFDLPELRRKALVQLHCHHKSVLDKTGEAHVLGRLGVDHEPLDPGCCGMAGAFGYEKGEKYRVAVAEGERVLLPKVRQAPKTSLVIADGFSCREQIAQGTGRKPLHLAQVVRMAQIQGPEGPKGPLPERGWVTNGLGTGHPMLRKTALRAALVGALGVGLWLGGRWLRRRAASRRG